MDVSTNTSLMRKISLSINILYPMPADCGTLVSSDPTNRDDLGGELIWCSFIICYCCCDEHLHKGTIWADILSQTPTSYSTLALVSHLFKPKA